MKKHVPFLSALVVISFSAIAAPTRAVPAVVLDAQRLTVTGADYRVAFHRHACQFDFFVRDRQGAWRNVARRQTQPEFALHGGADIHSTAGAPARLEHATADDVVTVGVVTVGVVTVLPTTPPTIARLHFVCTDDGMLLRFEPEAKAGQTSSLGWLLPRIALDEELFDAYAYWRSPDEIRAGRLADLGAPPTYVGVSGWGPRGDKANRLSARHPAVIARSTSTGASLGLVLLEYEKHWSAAQTFIQRHTPTALFLYAGIARRDAVPAGSWAWLTPMPADDAAAQAKVERLLARGASIAGRTRSLAPKAVDAWTRELPDFPAALRRAKPVDDLSQAIVYTIDEPILSDAGLDSMRKSGSDVLIRAWFKWHNDRDWSKCADVVPQAHKLGARFGGGITCSALYHGENGLSEQQVLDMATRGPDGRLVDAWKEPNCRHGTLSNPVYLEYLLSWCKRQIDAGADCLFMDEINAALHPNEGFDDYSIADFRKFLTSRYTAQGWTPTDARWQSTFKIELGDRDVAADGSMNTFHYRAYLKRLGLTEKPHAPGNLLNPEWHRFRHERDDRAWKWLTDAIRAHAATKGRPVWISGNGLAPYVDFQVLGVWDRWRTRDGRVDLAENQLETWGSIVAAGWGIAGRRVPVVLFHDWGFGGFPWMEISPDDRRLWTRVRGAEIYAAGGFFAFPVRGPFGNDARQDGTLEEVARQSAFYHQHQDLYSQADLLGFEPLATDDADLSVALWRGRSPESLILHVVNRRADDGQPARRASVSVRLPVDRAPQSVRVVSPDWAGEKSGQASVVDGKLTVTVPDVDAYAVAILTYDAVPEVALAGRRIVPVPEWGRPSKNEFVVAKGGLIREHWALPGILHGNYHGHLRNPPTFVVNMPRGGSLRVHVRSVATQGARLVWQVDGRAEKTIDLPDRDRKNDTSAREYDETYELPIPPGRHRLTLDNTGGDWAVIGWYALTGAVDGP